MMSKSRLRIWFRIVDFDVCLGLVEDNATVIQTTFNACNGDATGTWVIYPLFSKKEAVTYQDLDETNLIYRKRPVITYIKGFTVSRVNYWIQKDQMSVRLEPMG
jgi:hypothetical protein